MPNSSISSFEGTEPGRGSTGLVASSRGVDPAIRPANRRPRGAVRLALFFLVFGAAAWAANAFITGGLRRIRTSDYGVANQLVRGAINADIVITGSSRAYDHYDPRVIGAITGQTAFNIGKNGSQTDMQVAVLKTYLSHNRAPRLVIHNLDLFTFLTSHEIYDPAQYLPYLDEPAIYAGVRRTYPDAWKWKYIPLYGYAVEDMRFAWLQGVEVWVGRQPVQDDFLGFHPRYTGWTGDFDRFRAAHPQGLKTEIEPQGVSDFEDLIRICQSRGIRLLLVYSPEYRPIQRLETNRAEIFALFHRIAARHGVPLWDYSASPLCDRRDAFYNSQHLNAEGAAEFSRNLAQRLRASGLASS